MDPTLKIDYIKLKNQKLAVSIRINSSHPKLISSITILLLEKQKEEKKGKGKRKRQKRPLEKLRQQPHNPEEEFGPVQSSIILAQWENVQQIFSFTGIKSFVFP